MMNPRTHTRGAPPDFTLTRPNPNPSRMTDALWWLVCMREMLEPAASDSGGTYANKAGFHNAGENLPASDHSIKDSYNRSGPWWKTKTAAHDWTFRDAQRGNYGTISKYTGRLIRAMKDPNDPRPDDVYQYTIGQADSDRVVEGYHERDDADTTGDESHLWHRHDSFRRNIVGSFPHMWKALTIDMGWTVAEWRRSLGQSTPGGTKMIKVEGELPELKKGMQDPVPGVSANYIKRVQAILNWLLPGAAPLKVDGDYGNATAAGVKEVMKDYKVKSSTDGSRVGEPEWNRLYAL